MALVLLAGLSFAGDLDVIVGFKGDADGAIVAKHGGKAGRSIGALGAMTARIPAARVARLRADPSVAYVEEDGFVSISKPGNGKGGPPSGGDTSGDATPSQETPWGITRVGGLTGTAGAGIKVAVIDTGLNSTHEDLAANIKGGADFTGSRKGTEDEHGHGSHVGGTIAAVDNDRGVIGVAPGAYLYAVRVLDRRGWGTYSGVAAGISWAASEGMQIANMSLGGGHSSTVQSACSSAATAGVLLIAAAGNNGDGSLATNEYSYPASYSTVVSVGATNSSDGLASFSNTNPLVEVSAPGVGVLSTYKNNGYATFSGTSMASPHAAGVAALIWKAAAADKQNATDVRAAMQTKVDDAGPVGRDNGYGYGIVRY